MTLETLVRLYGKTAIQRWQQDRLLTPRPVRDAGDQFFEALDHWYRDLMEVKRSCPKS